MGVDFVLPYFGWLNVFLLSVLSSLVCWPAFLSSSLELQELILEYSTSQWALMSCLLIQFFLFQRFSDPHLRSWFILVNTNVIFTKMFRIFQRFSKWALTNRRPTQIDMIYLLIWSLYGFWYLWPTWLWMIPVSYFSLDLKEFYLNRVCLNESSCIVYKVNFIILGVFIYQH